MRSLQVSAVVRLFLALWLAITPTFVWAGSMTLLGVGGAGAASPPSIDGSAVSTVGSTATNTVTLTTTNANDEIIVYAAANGCASGSDTLSVTSANLTFTQRAISGAGGGACATNIIVEFSAPSASALTSEVITFHVTPGAGITYEEVLAFGVHGVNTGSPFDANGSIPSGAISGTLSLSTNHAADIIVVGQRGGGAPTTDSGFTTIINGSFFGAEYKQVTTTQSGLSVGAFANNGIVADAIVSP